jgi:hypothetical protein
MSDDEAPIAEPEPESPAAAPPPFEPLPAGVHFDVPDERYHAGVCPEPELSASIAKILVNESAAKAWQAHPRLGGAAPDEDGEEDDESARKEKRARQRGKVIDALVFGGEVKLAVIPIDSWRTKWAKEQKEIAIANGEEPVLQKHFNRWAKDATAIKAQLEQMLADNGYEGAMEAGKSQVTITWQAERGIWCKARLDHLWVMEDRYLIWDLKTSYDASPEGAARAMNNFGIPIQRAAYVEAVEHHHPHLAGKGEMLFLYLEPLAPFDGTANRPDGEMRDLGERQWKRAKRRWAECLEAKRWPGYPRKIIDVAARTYLLQQDEERQFNDQGANELPDFMRDPL